MPSPGLKERIFTPRNRVLVQLALLVITAALAFAALVLPIATRPSSYALAVGDVSSQDIQAPSTLNYVSSTLTDQARNEAEQRVLSVFLPADPAIARRQIEKLRTTLNYISVVRFDAYASVEQKFTDLSRLADIQITRDDVDLILSLNEVRWETIQNEALNVLEQVMRDTIRDDQLSDRQRRIPTLISFAFASDQASVISDLVSPFVISNSLLSPELTKQARDQARNAVQPVTKNFIAGETIVRRGQIITPIAWEALEKFGLVRPQNYTNEVISALSLISLLTCFTGLYFNRRRMPVLASMKGLILTSVIFLIFLFAARLVIPNRAVIPYIYPLAAFGLTIAALFNMELGLVLSIVLGIVTAYALPNSLDLTLYYVLSSMIGVLVLGKANRINNFFWAGMAIGAAGSTIIIAYKLLNPYFDLVGVATLVGASFFSGLAAASLSLFFQYLFSQLLGITTALQLLEISRPDHPLLQFILTNAPGSYQHSLQVAVLAEQAAEKIGADAMLVRVGGLYHDAGKAVNPQFFIENQLSGKLNPHDDLDPVVSAQTIINHVADGVMLAKKYRLPPRIYDFIREHHGTHLTRYQYVRALEAVGNDSSKVDSTQFQYPGPIPGSRETALLMLADGTQARVRAELPDSDEKVRDIVKLVIDYSQREGQLNDTRLTLRDLNIITESFVDTMRNTYHPRIRYPMIAAQPAAKKNLDPEP